ncbi:MAG: hypothetical protein KKC03_04420 [Bacteroidetes bacterium]|nr:hypothetical protein [Bacteroidota bacterium]
MDNLTDLHIEKEILPLFDYTHNRFSKKTLCNILQEPLSSVEDIITRQNILKGFLQNNPILENYSYTVSYLYEVHDFLTNQIIENLSEKKLRYRLFASKHKKSEYKSKFIQMLLFFHRLQSLYFSRLKTGLFPESYKTTINRLYQFLDGILIKEYEVLIREYKLKDKHIIELSAVISNKISNGEISVFWKDFFEFEAYLSVSQGIFANKFSFPNFTENNFSLEGFYHPVLKKPITNSFQTNKTVIVLTGPNMSGKSTLLKAVSLCVYLGHLGLAVPALKAEMPFYSGFSIQINHNDDIQNGYSHFMSEVMNLKSVVEEVILGRNQFAVFDELFSGTTVEDAYEILTTTIKGLSKFKDSIFFISTHLQQLKEMQHLNNANVSTFYIDCEMVDNSPIFTYKLKKGWSDLSVGKILFDKEGLNEMLS